MSLGTDPTFWRQVVRRISAAGFARPLKGVVQTLGTGADTGKATVLIGEETFPMSPVIGTVTVGQVVYCLSYLQGRLLIFGSAQVVPAFAVHAAGVQALTVNLFNIIAFPTELFNVSNAFAANTFTAPRAGLYRFSYLVSLNVATANTYFSALFKNGAEFQRGDIRYSAASGPQGLVGSFLLDLAAGDTVDVRVYPGAAVSTFTGDRLHVHFEGNFVGTKA